MIRRLKVAVIRLLIAFFRSGKPEIMGKSFIELLISNLTYVKEEHKKEVVVTAKHSVHDMGWPNDPVVEETSDTYIVYETVKVISAPLTDLVDNVQQHREKSLGEIDAWVADLLRRAERKKKSVILHREQRELHSWEQSH